MKALSGQRFILNIENKFDGEFYVVVAAVEIL